MVLKPGLGQEIVLGDATVIKVIAIRVDRVWLEIQSRESVRVEQKGDNAVPPEGAD
jgi:sRNA-binding carbon storage regulator CsrA